MMQRLRKFFKLGAGDRLFLLATFALLGTVRLGLCLLPFRTLLKLIETYSSLPFDRQTLAQGSMHRVLWAVELSSRYMPGGVKCLARALTTKVWLNWYGYPSTLRIGVAKSTQGTLEAHAWVESHGQIVIGNLQDLSRFTPLPSLSGVRI
jgi:hypothetical protein